MTGMHMADLNDDPTVCIAHGAFIPCRKGGEHRETSNPFWVKSVRDYQTSPIENLTWEPAWEAGAPNRVTLAGTTTATCGCPLDGPCTMHRNDDGHCHCKTCGAPVHIYGTHEDGTVEHDDHDCPPGLLPCDSETNPTNARQKTQGD